MSDNLLYIASHGRYQAPTAAAKRLSEQNALSACERMLNTYIDAAHRAEHRLAELRDDDKNPMRERNMVVVAEQYEALIRNIATTLLQVEVLRNGLEMKPHPITAATRIIGRAP